MSAVVVLLAWGGAVVFWRLGGALPGGAGLVVGLVVVPLILLALLWLLFRRADKRRRNDAGNGVETAAVAVAEDPTLGWCLPVAAAGVLLACGDDVDVLMEAATQRVAVDLHPSLRNMQEQPVMVAQVADVDIEAVDETLPPSASNWSHACKRTLALAWMHVVPMLEMYFDGLRPLPDPNAPLTRKKMPVLRVDWLLPKAWTEVERGVARDWLARQLSSQGWREPELQLQVHAAQTGLDVLQRLDAVNKAWHGDALALPLLVMASESFVDQGVMAQWDGAHRLHAAGNPEGKVPGEGAASILVLPKDHHAEVLPVQLSRVFTDKRDKPVDQPQRLQVNTLKALAARIAAASPLPDDMPVQLVADTDLRSSRSAEALAFAESYLPDEDPMQSTLPLGLANGDAGLALPLACMAVAIRAIGNEKRACLVFLHQHPSMRGMLQVMPASKPESTLAEPEN